MRVVKKELVTKKVEVIKEEYSLCDKCDKKIDDKIGYNFSEFTLELREGTCFPSYNSGTTTDIELCEDCADDCIKLLKENGYKTTETKW